VGEVGGGLGKIIEGKGGDDQQALVVEFILGNVEKFFWGFAKGKNKQQPKTKITSFWEGEKFKVGA